MRITRIKGISALATLCAVVMIFLHMVIPHSHKPCSNEEGEDKCISYYAKLSQISSDTGSHYHCMIINSVYQNDSAKRSDTNLQILAVQHWGYTYSPIVLPTISVLEYLLVFGENHRLKFISQKLQNRAPPLSFDYLQLSPIALV